MSKLPIMFRPLARYAEFHGRSNRAEFWLFVLLMYLVSGTLVALVLGTSLSGGNLDTDRALSTYLRWSPPFSLINLALIIPYLAVAVRRMHDTGRTGWWLAMPAAVSAIAYIVFFVVNGARVVELMWAMASQMPTDPAALSNPLTILKLEWPIFQLMLPWVMIPSAIAQIAFYILCVLPGTPGPNRFGDRPL